MMCSRSRKPGSTQLAGDGDTLVQPKLTPPLKPTGPSASPSPGAREAPCAACLLTATGRSWTEPEGRPSKSHKTAAKLGRATYPPWKEGKSRKDGVPGPQSLSPSRSSYWDVSALLQNSTGEGPVPPSGLAPTQERPLQSKHMGVRGMELKCGLGQTCKRAQKTNGVGGGASRGCAMHHHKLPPKLPSTRGGGGQSASV